MGQAHIATDRRRASVSLTSLPIVVVVLAGCVLLAGCALPWSQRPTETLRAQPVMRLALAGMGSFDLSSIDPGMEAPVGLDTPGSEVVGLIFDQLVTLDDQLRPELWGAETVSISPDGLAYSFTLRPGQRFSDGTPVHASDYAYAMDRILNPCFQSPGSYLLWMLKDAKTFNTEDCTTGALKLNSGQTGPLITSLLGDTIVPDDGAGTLTLRLARPAAYFLPALATGGSFAIERGVVTGASLGQDGKWTDALTQGPTGRGGSGMFYLARWDHPTGTLVLKANPYWWGRTHGKTPWLRELDIHVFSTSVAGATNSGAPFDYAEYNQVGAPSGPRPAGLEAHTQPVLLMRTVMLNWQVPPFDNVDARRAFCLAINRQAIAKDQFAGGLLPGWNLVPRGVPGYSPSMRGIDGETATAGDPARARAYWSKYVVSLHGKPIPTRAFTYGAMAPARYQQLAQALVQQWNAVLPGANVQTKTVGDHLVTLDEEKRVQMFTFGWFADYPDPQDFLTLLYATTSSYDLQNASVPQADQLMAQADALFAPDQQAQRDSLYAQAEQLLVQQVAACPLGQQATTYLLSPKVRHFGQTAMGIVPLDDFVAATITR